jgi:hypothetical protein
VPSQARPASITAKPALAPPGGTVTVTGRAFPRRASGAARLSESPTVRFRVDRSGRARAVLRVRRTARPGGHRLVVRAGRRRVSTVLTVVSTPRPPSALTALSGGERVLVMPARGAPGTTFGVRARGWRRRARVRLRLARVPVATLRASARGAFTRTAQIPAVAAGARRLGIVSGRTEMSVPFDVTAPPAPAPVTAPSPEDTIRHLYVSPVGMDINACTSAAAPCRTLQRADALATPGTIVHVAAGAYGGPIKLRTSGTSAARTTFVSSDRWGAKISGGDAVTIDGDYVDFVNFELTGTTIDVEGSFSRAIGNRVHDVAEPCGQGAAIVVSGGLNGYASHDGEAIGNLVHDIGTGPRNGTCRTLHGIYASTPHVRIVDNVVYRVIGDGITSWHAATNLTIANNTSVANGGCGVLVGSGDSGATSGNAGSVVTNNLTSGNALSGVCESSDGVHQVGPNVFSNNLMFANGNNDLTPRNGGAVTGSIVANPLFVSEAGDDYHVQPGSPAIDAGTSTAAPPTDFDGAGRPQGGGYDIGAYER